ncbi:MAG: hypothetical protein Kow0088_12640 [Anaerolineales bacterium]
MLFAIALLIVIGYLSYKASPKEREEDAHVHGAGQIGLLAALALFGVDYFTSFYYATGEMMSALHPYGLQKWGYIATAIIAFANIVFGFLYMYSLGIFNEGGGSYTASMRYLSPTLSLTVAVVLIQDYIFTIVVSTLSGADQLLSILNQYDIHWIWHFLIGTSLALVTYYLTIRGRGESAKVVFMLLGFFFSLTLIMFIGLLIAHVKGVPPVPYHEPIRQASFLQALYHLLTASMKGLVALTGLEAMSNGIQFVRNEDAGIVRWGKQHLPRLKKLWDFYSGKSGIGRFVQTSFLFYGGLTTLLLTTAAIRFNVYDGTLGRTLVGNLAYLGFGEFPGGTLIYWFYQFLAVALLSAASMTAYQDIQAMTWRNVAIGELPEIVVYRNPKGTFTRPVTAAVSAAIIIEFLVRGSTSAAVPYYGVGVFLPIFAMALSIRKHFLVTAEGRTRRIGSSAATFAAVLAITVFIGQIVGKWEEGGWMVLISFAFLIFGAHAILVSPAGYRTPQQIYRIVREKSRVHGPMGAIVEWQSLKMQEYRYTLLLAIARFFELFGVHRPLRFEPPPPAGDYSLVESVHDESTETILKEYLDEIQTPTLKLEQKA